MLNEQLDWEHEMVYRGVTRFRTQRDKAIKGQRAHETSSGSRLMKSYVLQISDHIKAYLSGENGRRLSIHKLLQGVNCDALAMFTLRSCIVGMYSEKSNDNHLVRVAKTIATKVEDELRFGQFEAEHKEYYDTILRGFQMRHTTNYNHMHNSLGHLATQRGMEWHSWSSEEKVKAGALLIKLMMEVCDLTQIIRTHAQAGHRKPNSIVATEDCLEWIRKHDTFTELTHPDRMPCLIAPAAWTTPWDGGFWSARMRHNTPLVKRVQTPTGTRGEKLSKAIMPRVLRAVNGLQDTPWRVNAEVHEVMKIVWKQNLEIGMPRSQPYEFPVCPLGKDQKPSDLKDGTVLHSAFNQWRCTMAELHAMETERQSKNRAMIRTMRLTQEMRQHEEFYYVYQCDFRGRIYCATTGLSPQGTDQSKALLTFGRSVPLGVQGLFWLKVHGANKYGFDKVSYDKRVEWIDHNHGHWLAIAADPIGCRNGWQDADKPWQFLAFVFEYAAAIEFGEGFRSSLPIALDGSCNGLQHFSAMLRDPVGGAAVNLMPSDIPHDIYQQVADVCTDKLKVITTQPGDNAGAINWLRLFSDEGMPRKLSKKPVMTLPYGSTMNACTSSIFQWIHDEHPDFFDKNTTFKHALYLSPILWASISEVVIAARAAMDWIQKQTVTITKTGCPLEYSTALGFPVYQSTKKLDTYKITTHIGGRLRITLAKDRPELDARKQRQGSAPNLIHSVDATHLMMVLNAALDEDMDCFAMIHDDFGVHAAHIDRWHSIIRETFVTLHDKADILPNFKADHELLTQIALENLPDLQTLEINAVLTSDYFFG